MIIYYILSAFILFLIGYVFKKENLKEHVLAYIPIVNIVVLSHEFLKNKYRVFLNILYLLTFVLVTPFAFLARAEGKIGYFFVFLIFISIAFNVFYLFCFYFSYIKRNINSKILSFCFSCCAFFPVLNFIIFLMLFFVPKNNKIEK